MLQSSFIIGLSFSSLLFGHVVHFYGPFYLVAFGLTIWLLAVIFSGLAFYANSFVLLIIGRVLSGVGEASFQCCIPPWIEINASPETKATWLSLFYTAIPVGTALGFIYSAFITSSLGWQFAFLIQSLIMFPFVTFFYYIAPLFPQNPPGVKAVARQFQAESLGAVWGSTSDDVEYVFSSKTAGHESVDISKEFSDYVECTGLVSHAPSMMEELRAVTRQPIFLCLIAGYAAQTAALIGISTFGSSFGMGLGFFDSETSASSTFGAVVCVAGLVGTPLGGYVLDQMTRKSRLRNDNPYVILRTATSQIACLSLIAFFLLMSVSIVENKVLFLLLMALGCAASFATNTGISISVMETVPALHRSFAIALVTVCIHLLGDVPSPILVGLMKDSLAPSCVGSANASVSRDCRAKSVGLRWTIFTVTMWMLWTVAFFTIAWRLSVRKCKRSACLRLDVDFDPSWLLETTDLQHPLVDTNPTARD